ncbi:MAG: hypothetical protein IJS58_02665 [Bacilli bacterium]|nr:hypothetical protein [Bacilli bacterium]
MEEKLNKKRTLVIGTNTSSMDEVLFAQQTRKHYSTFIHKNQILNINLNGGMNMLCYEKAKLPM